jgi:Amt family ammonium transporter
MGGILRWLVPALVIAGTMCQTEGVFAQETPDLAAVNEKADAALLAGHNAWMLTSCALVLFMTAPGLAMF